MPKIHQTREVKITRSIILSQEEIEKVLTEHFGFFDNVKIEWDIGQDTIRSLSLKETFTEEEHNA